MRVENYVLWVCLGDTDSIGNIVDEKEQIVVLEESGPNQDRVSAFSECGIGRPHRNLTVVVSLAELHSAFKQIGLRDNKCPHLRAFDELELQLKPKVWNSRAGLFKVAVGAQTSPKVALDVGVRL